jgi:hypothetical protein
VSEQATAPPASAGQAAPKRENIFTHKIGPLPMWAWVAIVGGLLVGWRLYSNKSSASQNAASGQTTTPSTPANQVPQFVNQFYLNGTAPTSPSSAGGSPAPAPVPVGTGPAPPGAGNPKPPGVTPTSGGGNWTFPAPTGLQSYDVAKNGYRLSWNPVRGPTGQTPQSYTIATYNAKGNLVDQFQTQAANTNTAEYGKGGKGLAKGTYHSNVWANGAPVAPPHATVQVSLAS